LEIPIMSIPLPTQRKEVRLQDRSAGVFRQPPTPAATPGEYGNSDDYDRYMGRWSSLLARRFLEFVGLDAAERVLDVGSGTGSLTGVVAASTDASWIVGLDPVASFVRAARQRFGGPRVTFERGEVDNLPYPDDDFDATLAQLSFHHFPNARSALNEMVRVTRSGGIVAACEWDSGPDMEMFYILQETLAAVHPRSGAEHSLRHYARRNALLGHWRARRIEDAEERPLVVSLPFANFDDFWVPFVDGPSNVIRCLNGLSPSIREDFRRALRHRLLDGRPDGPIMLRARAWAVRGRVP
jgi:SAM-dependent methyltransferase